MEEEQAVAQVHANMQCNQQHRSSMIVYANERQVESKRKKHQRLPVLCEIPSTHLKAKHTHAQKNKKKQKRRSRIETEQARG